MPSRFGRASAAKLKNKKKPHAIRRIFTDFTDDKPATIVDQVPVDRKGVCQDFAHVAISCLRSLGLAARYVSGYLETSPTTGEPRLIGADASHAWISLFVPDAGWVDLDPTNNLIAMKATSPSPGGGISAMSPWLKG